MKKFFALFLAAILAVATLAACSSNDDEPAGTTGGGTTTPDSGAATTGTEGGETADIIETGERGEGLTINVWTFTNEVACALERYQEMNPDFKYEIKATIISDQNGEFEQALNQALMAGGSGAPDMYVVEQAFVVNYTKFDWADYALPYKELFGSELDSLVAAADIASYMKEAGTNPNGDIVGLGFQSTGSAFIYRRDLATEIWGTDDPAVIETKIGPGWDQFLAAAGEAKGKGISMLSGEGDLWQAIRQSPQPWIQNGKLVIDDQRMQYLDLGYQFFNNGYTNKAGAWGPGWWADMSGTGDTPVLGFLGPAWLINYCIAGNSGDTFGNWAVCQPPTPFCWGGSWSIANAQGNPDVRAGVAELIKWITLDTSDTGFQYLFANNKLYEGSNLNNEYAEKFRNGEGAKDAVASAVVLAKSDGTLPFLGGQNMFDVFIPAGNAGTSSGWGPSDRAINDAFNQHATTYFEGAVSKDEAVANFKSEIRDVLGIDVD